MQEFVKVAVNLQTNKPIKTFTYKIPTNENLSLGSLVVVPFRNSLKAGYVVGFDEKPEYEKLKSVLSTVKDSTLPKESVKLAHWIAQTYIASEWSSTRLFLPPGSRLDVKEEQTIVDGEAKTIYSLKIRKVRKPKPLTLLYEERYDKHINLTKDQENAIDEIGASLLNQVPQTYLLNGITGSGKTEVYALAIEKTLAQNKSVILLVPEIAMSVQVVARLSNRFSGQVAVLHSGLTTTQRLSAWKQIKDGQLPIVIGARSAIFAPVINLGLVIVDEEHESSYKQNRSPRYNGKDVAIKRAQLNKAVCVLGSATPSIESRYKCDTGEYKQLRLTTKPSGAGVKIDLVDMRELNEKSLISSVLVNAIKETLASNHKALLLLNRRGFSSFLLCPACGHVCKCKRCSVSLTYHQTDKSLRCHHCDYRESAPQGCPNCGSTLFRFAGSGTQKLEQKINELFSDEVVLRLDRDNSDNKSAALAINKFKQADKAILLGTQIVGKGLDFADVTLVGIINADTSLNFSDFRAGEKTFQLLHQVAGRCGRGKIKGRVIIQTYNSEHYAIEASYKDNYEDFYSKEIDFRRELGYPPFSRLINIGFSCADYEVCKKRAAELAARLIKIEEIEVLGPAEAPIGFLKNRFRWHILVKTADKTPTELIAILRNINYRDATVSIDVDPISLN